MRKCIQVAHGRPRTAIRRRIDGTGVLPLDLVPAQTGMARDPDAVHYMTVRSLTARSL
jgi:hypothetical protein